mgnify:CR=1 FL=1
MNKHYDYLIVGAGLFGSVFSYAMRQKGKTCLVIDKRDHLAGNIYTREVRGIQVHEYGAHIFHTSNRKVWNYVQQFAEFNHFVNSPMAIYKNEIYNLPFNMNTFSKLWGIKTPAEAKAKIEEQIAEVEKETTESDNNGQNTNSEDASPFKNFSGQDFDGNSVDESLFSENAVTVINFWFTGCKPCVAELSKLNELNDAVRAMGGEVVGINTETFDGNESAIKEAAAVLESQGAKYRNLSIDSSSDAGKYASNIMAFPTTILVDRNGNIVGDPMLGGIDNQDNYDTLMKQIQSVIDADSSNK